MIGCGVGMQRVHQSSRTVIYIKHFRKSDETEWEDGPGQFHLCRMGHAGLTVTLPSLPKDAEKGLRTVQAELEELHV